MLWKGKHFARGSSFDYSRPWKCSHESIMIGYYWQKTSLKMGTSQERPHQHAVCPAGIAESHASQPQEAGGRAASLGRAKSFREPQRHCLPAGKLVKRGLDYLFVFIFFIWQSQASLLSLLIVKPCSSRAFRQSTNFCQRLLLVVCRARTGHSHVLARLYESQHVTREFTELAKS